jgi:hypothetical protein
MDTAIILAAIAIFVSVVGVLVSLASVRYTRQQAAEASATRAIGEKSQHDRLTPELKFTCSRHGSEGADITVELAGPAGLDRLDEVTVRVRDDIPDRKPTPGTSLTQKQISEVIWGPYRIRLGLRDTDQNGRAHGPFLLPKNEPYPLPMEHSIAPSWAGADWHGQYVGTPIRLEFTCKRAGDEPWVIPIELEPPSDIMNTVAEAGGAPA